MKKHHRRVKFKHHCAFFIEGRLLNHIYLDNKLRCVMGISVVFMLNIVLNFGNFNCRDYN